MAGDEEVVRVSTLELFFDLVFVFTVTQLTTVLVHDATLEGLAQVSLMLGLIWWMCAGYAWLTNAVPPDRGDRRLILLAAMGSYLVLALAIPSAFSGAGLSFGIAYAAVIVVHSWLYSSVTPGRMVTVSPFNLGAAVLVVAGGIAGGTALYVLWTIAFLLVWTTPRLIDDSAMHIAPPHFVERHGLVVIVTIGESVVAIGIGAAGLAVDLALVLVATLGLALSAALWWAYFGGDEERAERALTDADPRARPRLAVDAFGYAHLPILLGIVAMAAAVKQAIGHAFDPLDQHFAIALAGGLAAFLLGEAMFRRSLGIGRVDIRLAAAAIAIATIPLGTKVAAVAQMGALVALMAVAMDAERRQGSPPAVPARAGV